MKKGKAIPRGKWINASRVLPTPKHGRYSAYPVITANRPGFWTAAWFDKETQEWIEAAYKTKLTVQFWMRLPKHPRGVAPDFSVCALGPNGYKV